MGDAPDPPPVAASPEAKPPDSSPDALPDATPAPSATSATSAPPASPTPPGGSLPVTYNRDAHYLPIIIMTGVFGALFIVLPLLVRKGPNRGIIRCSIMMSLFCIWIFWVTIYISQLNPIVGPRMRNTTIAWLAHKIGNPIKHPTPSTEGEQTETF